jgi:hypothetical protein
MELKDFKKEYEKFAKKYEVPSFKDLNKDFEIDKLDKDNDYLLRAIRKIMMEKVVNSMSFLEMLLNPMNTPRMYLAYIRTMSDDDRDRINRVYGVLADLSLMSLNLEIDSNEKAEAELISLVFKNWNGFKKDFMVLLGNMKSLKGVVNKKERSYFG